MPIMRIFRITFINQGKLYLLYAESVRQADIYGFVEIEGLVFGESSTLVVDPTEERLKSEFNGVSRTLIPMHAIVRIDEVEKRGQSKILELDQDATVTPFPNPFYNPGKKRDP